jgi:hypothetical protein
VLFTNVYMIGTLLDYWASLVRRLSASEAPEVAETFKGCAGENWSHGSTSPIIIIYVPPEKETELKLPLSKSAQRQLVVGLVV